MNAKNVLRPGGDFGKQRLAGHAVVAFRMVGWNVALVAPKKVDLLPRDIGLGRQQGVKGLRGGAAGERDGKSSTGPHRLRSAGRELRRCSLKQFRSSLQNANFRFGWHAE